MKLEDFPILSQDLIYLDSGATSLKPKCVIDKINEYYTKYSANTHRGDYDLSLKVDQNKPEIMLVAGPIGVIGATVLACRASIKAKDIIDEHNAEMDLVNSDEIDKDDPENKKQIRKLYLRLTKI